MGPKRAEINGMRIGAAVARILAFLAGIVLAFLGSGKFAHDSLRADHHIDPVFTDPKVGLP